MLRPTRRAMVAAALALPFLPRRAGAETGRYLRIGAGSAVGTYFDIAGTMVTAISKPVGAPACAPDGRCGVPGLVAAVVTTAGSIANLAQVESGTLETGLAQADAVATAVQGADGAAPATNVRHIASLYPESLHLVLRADAGISSAAELGGRRVAVGIEGSGTRPLAEALIRALKVDQPVESVPAPPDEAALALGDGTLDAMVFVGGHPSPLIARILRSGEGILVPLDETVIADMVAHAPDLAAGALPAGTYGGSAPVPTVQTWAQWIAGAQVDEDLVFELTRALFHPATRQLLAMGHARASDIALETALQQRVAELHPGAARFYRVIGLADETAPATPEPVIDSPQEPGTPVRGPDLHDRLRPRPDRTHPIRTRPTPAAPTPTEPSSG